MTSLLAPGVLILPGQGYRAHSVFLDGMCLLASPQMKKHFTYQLGVPILKSNAGILPDLYTKGFIPDIYQDFLDHPKNVP